MLIKSLIRFDGSPRQWLKTSALAALLAGFLSGIPSTLWAWLQGTDPLEATRAAGALLVGPDANLAATLAAAALVHGAMSGFWACTLCALLPRNWAVLWGLAAGAGIAVMDIALIGRFLPAISGLAFGPQLADHLAFGGIVGAVIQSSALSRFPRYSK
jgi:hypothetical protein